MLIMCQCLFTNSLAFGNERLNVMMKRIMSARTGLEVFKSDILLRLSFLLIWLWMLASL